MGYVEIAEVIPYDCPLGKDNCLGCEHYVQMQKKSIVCSYDQYQQTDDEDEY